jgi:hypothetical protein
MSFGRATDRTQLWLMWGLAARPGEMLGEKAVAPERESILLRTTMAR